MTVMPLSNPTSEDLADLNRLLRICVESGASIGFILPVQEEEVRAYWLNVCADLARETRLLWVLRDPGTQRIIGSVQLACELRANGRHRAEVQKLMVLPEYRRCGHAARLISALEDAARRRGMTLLFLDTSEGKGGAVGFYGRQGYTYVGGIPGYAADPDGARVKNAIFYKTLALEP